MNQPDEIKQMLSALETMDLEENIQRVDELLLKQPSNSVEQMGFRLGIRLALGMAFEIKSQKGLGSETGELIAGWVKKYGQAHAEEAIKTARSFLINPGKLKSELEERILPGKN